MKIFFAASIHGRDQYLTNYKTIVEAVEAAGHKVIADHILEISHDQMVKWDEKTDTDFFKKNVEHLKQADVFFAEVSYNSTSVGYLTSLAVQAGKPVALFYSGDQEPHLFRTLEKTNDRFQVVRYKDASELKKEIPYVLDFAASSQDVRFNFFISPELSSYLDWIAKNRKVPRSVYLRQLIDDDMGQNSYTI